MHFTPTLVLAALLLTACNREPAPPRPKADAAAEVKGVDRSHKGQRAPEVAFKDAEGEDVTLEEFEGKPTLVNLWASWCAPCVKELPTLDRLHSSAKNLQVAAVSQDIAPHESVVAFLDKTGVKSLTPYQDPEMKLSGALGAQILPTTILYDAGGFEVWRYTGDLDWTSAEASMLLAEAGGGAKN